MALLVGLTALVAAPAVAAAQKRIVILDFSGPKAAKYQEAITDLIEKEHTVVPGRDYARAAKKLRATKPTSTNVAKVAEELEADGVLIGSVKKKRGRYTVTVRLRTSTDGEFTDDTITADSAKPRLTAAQLKRFKKELGAAIEGLPSRAPPPPPVGDDDDDDVGGDDDVAAAGDDEEEEEVVTKKKKGDDASPLTDAEKADLAIRGRGVEAIGGISFSARTLSFTVRDGLGDLAPRGYEGTLVAGAYLAGELYPLAFNRKKKSITHNLGVAFVFDRVLKIESRMLYDDGTGTPAEAILPTTQSHWGAGLVYRHNFGKKPTSPTLKLAVRYNSFGFVIDKAAAPAGVTVDIPNMEYVYWDPGLAIRFPVHPKIALLADARYLLVTGAGDMQQATEYGGSTLSGYDVDVGFEYRITRAASVRAGGRFTGISLSFDGTGTLTTDRDGDSASQDVLGASDQFVGGYVVAGLLF